MKSALSTKQTCALAMLIVNFIVVSSTFANLDSAERSKSMRIAVATNFAPVLDEIVHEFAERKNIVINVVSGSTGKLYAQIKNGMDADLFLAADQVRIRRLVDEGIAIGDTLTTYAEGRLVWWHPRSQQLDDAQQLLNVGNDIEVIAYAQPDLAPYGRAAEQALSKCFRIDRSRIRFVHGENVGQTYAHVATGNADAGLVALASIKLAKSVPQSSYVSIPRACHEPIKQDAVVLKSSRNEATAREFLEFLRNERIQVRLMEFGYTVL